MKTTAQLQTELGAIIDWFESDDVDIDKAASQYKKGMELATELQKRLAETKNTITKLKQSFTE